MKMTGHSLGHHSVFALSNVFDQGNGKDERDILREMELARCINSRV